MRRLPPAKAYLGKKSYPDEKAIQTRGLPMQECYLGEKASQRRKLPRQRR
jgi:hypothetical protein